MTSIDVPGSISLWCSVHGRTAPNEPFGGNDSVDQESEGRERDQRDIECRPHLHEECEVMSEDCDRERKDETADPRVGRGARIGYHEEREDQQRSALQL